MSLLPWDLCPLLPFLFASFFSSLLSTWILPSTGGGVGGDSVCFQPFFFFKSTKNKNFLFFLKSKVYLFFFFLFFFFFLTETGMDAVTKIPLQSFFLSTFRSLFFFLFFSWLYLFFLLFLCSNFSAIFIFFMFLYFPFFFCFCGRSFPPPSTLCTRMIRLWPVDFNLA